MNSLRTIIFDRDRPLIVTVIAVITALFAAYRLLRVIEYLFQYPHLFSVFYILGPILSLTLAYFLLIGKNWTRLVFAFLSILCVLWLTIVMVNQYFTIYGIIAVIYALLVFGTLTMKQKVVAYFKKHKGLQHGGVQGTLMNRDVGDSR